MEFIDEKTIRLDKKINEVDLFVFKFIDLLEKYTNYVIISGYVSILFGRNRGTDDIDMIIPKMTLEQFSKLYKAVISQKFWCLNSPDIKEVYELLTTGNSIRFAIEPETTPNIEIKFVKSFYDNLALQKPITLLLGEKKLKTSFLELQIAYKEEVLKSNKDLEDARHLRLVAKEYINDQVIEDYKKELRNL
jgi:hypothetical protein